MAAKRPPLGKRLSWRLEVLGFDVFTFLVRLLPVDTASAMGGALLKAVGPLTGAHRNAERGLRLAFPDMADDERARLLAAQWENFGRYIFEFPLLDRLTPDSGRVEIVNPERLTAIAASDKGAVMISGHFANLEIMAAVIVDAGIQAEVSYRAANNPHVDARIIRSRESYGVKLFAAKGRGGGRDLMAALKAGRSTAMLIDQRYDSGVPATFFGRQVMANPAPARLALRFDAVLQPMSVQRTRGARFRCIMHPPMPLSRTGDRTQDIVQLTQEISRFIECRIRERPAEWWWVHRRFPREDYAALKTQGL